MTHIGFTRSQFDHCVYSRFRPRSSLVIFLIYVDDILIASDSVKEVLRVKAEFKQEFVMEDLGTTAKIIGIDIKSNKKKSIFFLSQETNLQKILDMFGISNSKLVVTPKNLQYKLSISQCPSNEVEITYLSSILYANIEGSLMYAMVCTRPDIFFTIFKDNFHSFSCIIRFHIISFHKIKRSTFEVKVNFIIN